jgi:hypothetical protein
MKGGTSLRRDGRMRFFALSSIVLSPVGALVRPAAAVFGGLLGRLGFRGDSRVPYRHFVMTDAAELQWHRAKSLTLTGFAGVT